MVGKEEVQAVYWEDSLEEVANREEEVVDSQVYLVVPSEVSQVVVDNRADKMVAVASLADLDQAVLSAGSEAAVVRGVEACRAVF